MNTTSSLRAIPGAGSPQPTPIGDHRGYVVAGSGAPVVLLHASLSSKSQWTTLLDRMAPRFRMIALDLCGYGDNELVATESSFTLDDEVRLVASRLDQLVGTRTRVHLVGHSYGGLVALRFAQVYAERVASLSLFEPVVFRLLDDDPAITEVRSVAERVAVLVRAGRRYDAAQVFVDFWSGAGSFEALALPVRASMARRIGKVPLDFKATSCWPLGRDELRAVVAPTLLLGGRRSPVVAQRILSRLAELLPDWRIGSFDCGHMGPLTDAGRVNTYIDAFVAACAERDGVASLHKAARHG
jgi:pimeloyl-ACP methyl ester carboxylesterase